MGGKANRLERISNGVIADLIIGSHIHTAQAFKEDILLPAEQTQALTQKTITYVSTSALLRYGGYAQKMGMKPATITFPKIYIRQKRDKVTGNKNRFFITEVLL